MTKYFDVPAQVIFEEDEKNQERGIAYKDEIICLCCGGIFEVNEVKILEVCSSWYEMSGEEFQK
jgi:hypothetical protein